MRIERLFLCGYILLLLGVSELYAQSYRAVLTGRGENTSVVTTGYGEITADLVEDTLTVSGWFRDLMGDFAVNVAGGSHIHGNYAGRNGGIAHGLTVTLDAGLKSGVWEADSNKIVLTPDEKLALNERALYVNVHSTSWTGGEIRGQLMPSADTYYVCKLLGSYENPATPTMAYGSLVLDVVEDTLTVSGTFNALSTPLNVNAAGGMHLHMGVVGQNGPISIPLTVSADTTGLNGVIRAADNVFTLTAEQKEALEGRRMYANVHSQRFAGGEIRGQVTGVSLAVLRGHMSGMNENPFVPSRAGGLTIAEIGADSSVTVSGSFAGVASGIATDVAGGAHIHMAVAGRNGGIQFPLNMIFNVDTTDAVFSADSNVFKANAAQFDAAMSRGLYVNVHSNMVRSGELRGQLLPESQMAFTADISSVSSIPPVRSAAGGLIKAELNGNQLILSGSFAGLSSDVDTSIAGGAHIHMAVAGSTGPVIFPLDMRFEGGDLTQAILGSNVFTLDAGQIDALMARGLYVNFHTLRYTPGEIRGQILPEAHTYFFASLAGSNESSPVKSGAIGQLILEYQRNGNATASGSFRNLEGELATNVAGGAHIHAGMNGQNGPVIIPVASETSPDMHSGIFDPVQNVFQISVGMADTLYALGNYVNVHSNLSPSGEIRGQLLPAANAHLNAVLRPMNEVQPILGLASHGSVSAVLSGGSLRVSGSFADLEGDFAANVAGGSHIHSARAGFNGGIAVPLTTRVAGDLKSGVFRSDTAYMVDAMQTANLLAGGMYVNIHTSTHAGGELRGQLLSNYNSFPEATSQITDPVPNSTVTVSSTSQDPLFIAWTASADADSLAYIIQVTPDPTFTTIPIQFNTANQRQFSVLTLAQIDTLLANFGIPIGFPISVNARVIASDGSLQSTGSVFSFTLLRQPPSAVRDLPDGWAFEAYPTLAQGAVQIDVVAPSARQLGLVLISGAGQQQEITGLLQNGSEQYHTSVDLSQCSPGLWIVGLTENGQLIGTKKVLVVK